MDRMRRYEEELFSNSEDKGFLIVYADLVTLILVFFILLYALSVRQANTYREKIARIKTRNNPTENHINIPNPSSFVIEEITGLRPRNVKLKKALGKLMLQEDNAQSLSLEDHDGKIILDVSGEALFTSGSAFLNPQAMPLFEKLALIFKQFPEYTVNIKGHTDNIPIATDQYPSNWELSAIRATTVLKYFIELGMEPRMLTATGYGDSIPKVPNISAANRAVNRRVEFVLEKRDDSF